MKKKYETPLIEVVEFVLEESIAASAAKGVGFLEDIWGGNSHE